MMKLFLLSLFATALSSPLNERQVGSPTVTIANGTVVGTNANGVDSFSGIPYAQPPTGSLRLKPARVLTARFGTFSATATPKACPQFTGQVDESSLSQQAINYIQQIGDYNADPNQSEDCLTVNVIRPQGYSAGANLPVLFWIYGGAFQQGSTSQYDGTSIVSRSNTITSLNPTLPIIYVSVNYRVGGFGFLAGKELAADHSTNLGLRDQRLALQWVQDNIAAFGGDPTKVTLWGESAGSISVFDHTVINGGDNSYKSGKLFRGAIMNSGSIIPADPVTAPKAQAIYNRVVTNAGCGSASDTLACLRTASYSTFMAAANSVNSSFGYRSLDLSYLPRPDSGDSFFTQSPELSVSSGAYTKVPVIIGDVQDEGTLFGLTTSNITNNAQLTDYLTSYFPGNPNARSSVTGLLSSSDYTDNPAGGQPLGAPFDTGSANNIYPEFKRLAAVLGDTVFSLTRRSYLTSITTASTPVAAWSYIATYFHGNLPVLGTFHGTDNLFAYAQLGTQQDLTRAFQSYYISFVNFLDPNRSNIKADTAVINWPQWSTSGLQQLNFAGGTNNITLDNYRTNAYTYLRNNPSVFRV